MNQGWTWIVLHWIVMEWDDKILFHSEIIEYCFIGTFLSMSKISQVQGIYQAETDGWRQQVLLRIFMTIIINSETLSLRHTHIYIYRIYTFKNVLFTLLVEKPLFHSFCWNTQFLFVYFFWTRQLDFCFHDTTQLRSRNTSLLWT